MVPVASNVANQTAQEVLRTDAVPASPSAGATLAAARELMEEKPEIKRVLCVFAGKELYE